MTGWKKYEKGNYLSCSKSHSNCCQVNEGSINFLNALHKTTRCFRYKNVFEQIEKKRESITLDTSNSILN